VANAYEVLGLVKEKERVLEKYNHLFTETGPTKRHKRNSFEAKKHVHPTKEKRHQKQSRKASSEEKYKSGSPLLFFHVDQIVFLIGFDLELLRLQNIARPKFSALTCTPT